MVEAFEVSRVNPNPARFDPRKCEAINASHIRLLEPATFADLLVPYLQSAGLLAAQPDPADLALLVAAAPLVQERSTTLGEAATMLGFLFVDEDASPATPTTRRRPSAAADARWSPRRATPWPSWATGRLCDRAGAARRAGRGPWPQASGGVRAGASRRHRQAHLPTAVRVAGAAGSTTEALRRLDAALG
jgi:glutamyl-tRNA synthetase